MHQFLMSVSVPVLYIGMFLMAFSGFMFATASGYGINFFHLFNVPLLFEKSDAIRDIFVTIHITVAPLMIFIVSSHIMASFYHHFYLKDETLKSML